MSLGVLNNISAIYAENNLNLTQASLQSTLQQLSSGSRINSGADDAAGLSLADGLQASSTALTQSAQNATEGVDFLQVADGALSQVTNLLNRAVTLATEASNGELNSTQEAATEAEYSSIMTEVNTINGNTEYNGINVFAKAANIYTSDGTVHQSYATTALGQTDSAALGLGSQVFTSGTVAAAGSGGGTDSNGNKIASGDDLLTATNSAGETVTYDLTVMGDSTTAAGSLSDTAAVAISGNAAIAGGVALATAAGTDEYGSSYGTTDYIFTPTTAPASGPGTISLGTTDPSTLADASYAGTSLASATQAQTALTAITAAISDVSSMRGTEGAEVNTLTAVENVEDTESTNTQSAQNDVTATDYAQASSNLSKYEILAQTGISALAQANSTEQLVTKLLQ
jgi:flagellin